MDHSITIPENLADLSTEELQTLHGEVEALYGVLYTTMQQTTTLLNAQADQDALNWRVLDAIGVEDGDAWRQPTGAHDAYPRGSVVEHDGKQWASLVAGNVWEPGVSGWREVAEEDEDGETTVPEFVQPTGTHDAYNTGDMVTFEGVVYESVIDGNVWSPTDHPVGWRVVT